VSQDSTIERLSVVYGLPEDAIYRAVYTLAEQLHQNFCLTSGIVNHSEARPDQQIAADILRRSAGMGWYFVQQSPWGTRTDMTETSIDAPESR
jgi:hypothetical protein